MIIEVKEFKDVNRAPYNPRVELKSGMPEYEKLKKSIETFGHVLPMVYNKTSGNLVGGHQTMTVLVDMGKTKAEMSIVELIDAEEKALNIGLNKIGGMFDNEKLSEILNELIDIPEFDIELTGFDVAEIGEIEFDTPQEDVKEDDFDADKALSEVEEPITKRGDIILLGRHRLMCGDSTDVGDVERLMDGVKADMVFTDPPYGLDYSGGRTQVVAEKTYGKLKNDDLEGSALGGLISNVFKFNKSEADVYICVSPKLQKPFLDFIENEGKEIDAVIVWDKRNAGLGYMAYRRQCEFILFIKGGKYHKGDKSDFDLWSIGKDKTTEYVHGTQKPIALSARAIENSSKKDDAVADFFGGSGSTMVACEQLNRINHTMELDPKYCDVIIKRWEEFTNEKAIRQ